MLAKKYRLYQDREFKRIFSRGNSVAGDFIVVKYLYKKTERQNKLPKFAIIVSKKISNKATVRNKLKRQISEILYSTIDQISQDVEIVVIVKKIAPDFQSLKNDWLRILGEM